MFRKGFTLVELMIVILIVGILAAVAVPLLMNRADAAKWSEGKAAMGTLATGIRTYYASSGCNAGALTGAGSNVANCNLVGLSQTDLDGTYFTNACYTWTANCTSAAAGNQINFTITCNAGNGRANAPTTPPAIRTLTDTGTGQAVFNPPM